MIKHDCTIHGNRASASDVLQHASAVTNFLRAAVADRMTDEGVHFGPKAAKALHDVLEHVVAEIDRARFLALVEQEERARS
jgi:hypothetical protein